MGRHKCKSMELPPVCLACGNINEFWCFVYLQQINRLIDWSIYIVVAGHMLSRSHCRIRRICQIHGICHPHTRKNHHQVPPSKRTSQNLHRWPSTGRQSNWSKNWSDSIRYRCLSMTELGSTWIMWKRELGQWLLVTTLRRNVSRFRHLAIMSVIK